MVRKRWWVLSIVGGLLGLTLGRGWPQEEGVFPPPVIVAPYVNPSPQVDGVLDDQCWEKGFRASGFYIPSENRPATFDTTLFLCCDEEALYVAFHAHDPQPELIRAFQTRWGGSMRSDDTLTVMVDPWGQGKDFYAFTVNPLGTRSERLPDVGSLNPAWRGPWKAAARIVEDGWVAEMAIPFALFRYPAGQTSFGIAFERNIERFNEESRWPPMPNQFDPRRVAQLVGLRLKGPKRRPLLMPYTILRHETQSQRALIGFDGKHTFANGLTVAGTIHPDFENVEDIVETIAFTEVERFFDDPRPFFAEGRNYLPDSSLLYTRRLRATDWGLKGFGKIGPHRLGVLAVREANDAENWALNYGYDHRTDSTLGFSLVRREEPGRENFLWSLYGRHLERIGRGHWAIGGRWAQSALTAAEDGLSYAFNLERNWGQGRWSLEMAYECVEPEYQALAGFVPENDRRGWSFRANTFNRGGRKVQIYFGGFSLSQFYRRDGSLLRRSFSGRGFFRLSNGTSYSPSFLWQHRPPHRDLTWGGRIGWGHNTLYRRGGWEFDYGSRGGAHYFFTALEQGWNPTPSFQLNLRAEYSFRDFFDPALPTQRTTQTVLTANYDFTPERSLSLRLVERSGKVNLFVAYRSAPATGRGLYFLFGDPNSLTTQSRWQVKMVWPF